MGRGLSLNTLHQPTVTHKTTSENKTSGRNNGPLPTRTISKSVHPRARFNQAVSKITARRLNTRKQNRQTGGQT